MTINLDVNVSGRFKVVDQPYAAPSKCAFCSLGHNQDGKVMFIDTTLDLDFYGVVYICSNCLTEIATSLGYLPPEKWQGVVEDSTNTLIENDRLAAENNGLRDAVNILTGHRCNNAKFRLQRLELEEEAGTDDPPSSITEGIEPVESKPDAPSSKQGLSDVRGTSKPVESKPSSRKSVEPVELDL